MAKYGKSYEPPKPGGFLVYKITDGVFDDTVMDSNGEKLHEVVFTRLHPKMLMLDAGADENGVCVVKGLGERIAFRDENMVRYWIDNAAFYS